MYVAPLIILCSQARPGGSEQQLGSIFGQFPGEKGMCIITHCNFNDFLAHS